MSNKIKVKKSKRIRNEIYRLQELSIQDSNFSKVIERIDYLNELRLKIKTNPDIEINLNSYGEHSKKPVLQFDGGGALIGEFDSINEAAMANNIKPHLVTYYLRTKRGVKKIGRPKKFYFKYK